MKNGYLSSHPWINFLINLEQAPKTLWIRLGEISAMCNQIAGVPLRPYVARQLHRIYLAKGARATTAIEGNTLSEQDVLKQIEGTLEAPESKKYLVKEVDNIVQACNSIFEECVKTEKKEITPEFIKELNAKVLDGLKVDESVLPGQIRTYSVGVANYKGSPYQDCEFLLQKLCIWLREPFWNPREPEYTIVYAVIKAVITHLYLAWIHPFGDGNGRTARLVEFLILSTAGIPMPATQLLSNHYNETRTEYYRQLDQASKSGGGVLAFLAYAVGGFIDGLNEQLRFIEQEQIDVAWRNHVHGRLEGLSRPARRRQRMIVYALPDSTKRVPLEEISLLSPQLANIYAGKSERTLLRDLRSLIKLKLIYKDKKGYSTNKNMIRAFLPARRQPMELPADLVATAV
jgi:Fic family protein